MINAIGLEGEGLDAFLRRASAAAARSALPADRQYRRVLGAGVRSSRLRACAGPSRRETGHCRARRDWKERDRPGCTGGIGLNISCPNVHSGCISIGADPEETEQRVAAVRGVWPGLLIAKLTPNVTDVAPIAQAAVRGGADALAAVNTFKGLVIDRRSLRPYLGNVTGGLSGPAIKPLALRCVYELFEAVEVPLIGMGGVVRPMTSSTSSPAGLEWSLWAPGSFGIHARAGRLAAELQARLTAADFAG